MHFSRFILLVGLSSRLAFATRLAPRDEPVLRTCGTESDQAFVTVAESDFSARRASGSAKIICYETVNVYWHVIKAGDTLAEGDLPESQITASIKATNSHYAGLGLNLKLASIDRTTNATWFNYVAPKLPTNRAMKNLLRKGGPADLNVYTVGFKGGPGKGLLGYATMPSTYESDPKDDGIERHLPTNSDTGLDCITPFRGDSCGGPGDYVDDTPPEETPTSGCPEKKDTCPGGGPDPIHNYMDYSYDLCMNQFTKGQFTRIKEQVKQYRGISL
ncbi:hypothetical protein OPQ81_005853 [Rhizoctonia solani]|nr:hypothetical protein OPQ81_005853 [Rhizoctonia solani]